MKTLIYRFIHWLKKHEFSDCSFRARGLGLVVCYFCETCGLQKILLGRCGWQYKVNIWLRDFIKG